MFVICTSDIWKTSFIDEGGEDKIYAHSAYFDKFKGVSYRMIVIDYKDIDIITFPLNESIATLCQFHNCKDGTKLEIVYEIFNQQPTLLYFSIINDSKTGTYYFRSDDEMFFFDLYNQIVGTHGIKINDFLPMRKGDYKFTDRFGIRPHPFKRGRTSLHGGLDFSAKKGTPIFAMASGTVIRATYHWDYGNHVMIDHGYGLVTLYGHMSKILVENGTIVEKNQKIGLVGRTGFSTGDHLHLEVHKNKIKCNPEHFFSFPKNINSNKYKVHQMLTKKYVNNVRNTLVQLIINRDQYLKLKNMERPPKPVMKAPVVKPTTVVKKTKLQAIKIKNSNGNTVGNKPPVKPGKRR